MRHEAASSELLLLLRWGFKTFDERGSERTSENDGDSRPAHHRDGRVMAQEREYIEPSIEKQLSNPPIIDAKA